MTSKFNSICWRDIAVFLSSNERRRKYLKDRYWTNSKKKKTSSVMSRKQTLFCVSLIWIQVFEGTCCHVSFGALICNSLFIRLRCPHLHFLWINVTLPLVLNNVSLYKDRTLRFETLRYVSPTWKKKHLFRDDPLKFFTIIQPLKFVDVTAESPFRYASLTSSASEPSDQRFGSR